MDNLDISLIGILRRNGRASISDIAAELGVTRTTVRTRLERLTRDGEILGFSVVLRGDVEDMPVRGIMLIQISGKGTERIIRQLAAMPEIRAIHTTNGRWDIVAELGAESLSELDVVLRKIRLFDGVDSSETNLYLATTRSVRGRRQWDRRQLAGDGNLQTAENRIPQEPS